MTRMKWMRWVLPMLLLLSSVHGAAAKDPLPVHDGVGGDFSIESSLGREVSLSEFRGKVVLIFFGYTSCQDICPATLSHLRSLMVDLESSRDGIDGVQVLLATVDPETDTPERLKSYLARFDDRFIGLTGPREEMERIASLFMVKHDRSHGTKVSMEHNREKAFATRGYLYSHSQQIYLLDKKGRTRAFFFTGSPLNEMKQATLALLAE